MAKESKIHSMIQSIAPPSFLQDEDTVQYLCSLLANPDDSPTEEDLMSVIGQFFGEEYENEAQMLAQSVMKLFLAEDGEENKFNSSPSHIADNGVANLTEKLNKSVSLSAKQHVCSDDLYEAKFDKHDDEHNADRVDDADEKPGANPISPDRPSSAPKTKRSPTQRGKGKKAAASSESQTKPEDKSKGAKQDAKAIKALAASQLEEIDDHSSAWAACVAEGKTWGGRGQGGRGLRSVYTSTTALVTSVHLQNVSLQFAGNDLLQNATIQITEKKRYGLIGRNGVGKSTLLRRLASKSIPGFPIQMKVLFVQQEAEGSSKSALQTLLDADEDRLALLEEQERLEKLMESADPEGVAKAAEQLSEVAAELELQDADKAEDRARQILNGLQFSESMIQSPTEHLSGGWKMRLSLAQALFVRSDLLLLGK